MLNRYSCTFSGACEEANDGYFHSYEACSANCQPQEQSEIHFLIYQYALAEAADTLAPLDRQALVRRVTGFTFPLADSYGLLSALAEEDFDFLVQYETLYPFLLTNYDEDSVARALFRIATTASLTAFEATTASCLLLYEYHHSTPNINDDLALAALNADAAASLQLLALVDRDILLTALADCDILDEYGLRAVEALEWFSLDFTYELDEISLIHAILRQYRVDFYEYLLTAGFYVEVLEMVEYAPLVRGLTCEFAQWVFRHYPNEATDENLLEAQYEGNTEYITALEASRT